MVSMGFNVMLVFLVSKIVLWCVFEIVFLCVLFKSGVGLLKLKIMFDMLFVFVLMKVLRVWFVLLILCMIIVMWFEI